MSSNIRVIDVNEDASPEARELRDAKQEAPTEEPIEEAKQEAPTEEPIEEVKEEVVNEVVEEVKQEVMVEKKIKAQDKLVRCPKCSREMKMKSFRYGHQQKCQGGIENTPVKPFSKPRAKPKAQPKPQPKIENTIEKQEVVELPTPQPTQPQLTPYEIARQSYIQMKEAQRARKIEKINMFKSKMF